MKWTRSGADEGTKQRVFWIGTWHMHRLRGEREHSTDPDNWGQDLELDSDGPYRAA